MAKKRNSPKGETSQNTSKAPAGEQFADGGDAVVADESPSFEGQASEREVLLVKTRHQRPYRRAGRVFDRHPVELDTSTLSPHELERLLSDPWLVVVQKGER